MFLQPAPISIADPNAVFDTRISGNTDVTGYYKLSAHGKTQVHPTAGGFSKTIVLAMFGTSNLANALPAAYSPTHTRAGDGKAVDELCIYNGGVYEASSPVMGCSFPPQATSGLGNMGLLLGSAIIDAAWSVTRVVLINFAIGGSTFGSWADTTNLGKNIGIANRLAVSRGLPITAWWAHIGENDHATADCATPLASVITNIRAVSSAPIFIPKASWLVGVTDVTVTAAQDGAVNHGNGVWAGNNADAIDGTGRQDNTHFDDDGAATYVSAAITALGLYGAPFA
jgi:hypothetical protein